jgi:hypothetical protein
MAATPLQGKRTQSSPIHALQSMVRALVPLSPIPHQLQSPPLSSLSLQEFSSSPAALSESSANRRPVTPMAPGAMLAHFIFEI